jgi:outer membrane protein assembly factor BamB
MSKLIVQAAAVMLIAAAQASADWPQYLGPNRSAVAADAPLLAQWPAGGPKVLWAAQTGPGFGGAAIADGQAFLLDRNDEDGDVLRVFDLKTGDELWRYAYDAPGRLAYHGSRSTPTVEGDFVYTVGTFGDVHCISRKTHEPVWHFNLGKRFTEGDLGWGYAQSPLVYKDMLILSPTHAETPALIAVKKSNGDTVWQSRPPNMTPAAGKQPYGSDYYASPILRTVAGRHGVMHITNHEVIFVDPDNGKELWSFTGYTVQWSIPAPTVLPSADGGASNLVFVTGGYGAGSVMIRVSRAGEGFKAEELWRLEADGCQIHPAIHHDGYLYANINENAKWARSARERGGLACIEPATGRIVWRTGADPFFSRGSVIKVGDKLLVQEGEEGTLHLVAPSPAGYRELARAPLLEARGGKAWAPMAFAGGLLLMRDQNELKCVDLRASERAGAAR